MKKRMCKQCGEMYQSTDQRRKFCSLPCYWQWRRNHRGLGEFKPGETPWNAGTKGVMQVNNGSYKKGRKSLTKAPLGAVRIRTRRRDGHQRAWVKVANNRKPYDWRLRAEVVWEQAHGLIPRGSVVHHKDRDSLNDTPDNLETMTRAGHINAHRDQLADGQRNAKKH